MAFSQVEIASNSPFNCVLRDRNRQDRCSRESNARAAFQKNLKDLVRDRLQSCMSPTSTNQSSDSNENSNPPADNVESKAWNEQSNKTNSTQRKSKANDRWSRAREMVFAIDNPEGPNQGGVSSLVQKWRIFEAGSKNLNSSRTNSGSTLAENPITEATQTNSEAGESVDERFENSTMTDETLADWESDTTTATSVGPPSSLGRDSDATESERIKVADIIRKLKKGQNVANDSLPKVRLSPDQTELKGLCPVMFSPKIRGRQAFSDLLMQMERDRHQELEGLGERKPVSRFSQKGRIQALLRVKLLRRGSECRDNRLLSPMVCKLNEVARGSTIMHLRERFSALVDHCASNSRTPCREAVDHLPDLEKSSTSNQLTEEIDKTQEPENSSTFTSTRLREDTKNQHEVTSLTSHPKEVVHNNTQEPENSSTSKRPREEEIHHLEINASTSCHKEVVDNTTPDLKNTCSSKRPREEIRHHEVTYLTSNCGELVDNASRVESSSTSNELKEATMHYEDANTCVHSGPQVQNSENPNEERNFGPQESAQEADIKNLTRSTDEMINDSSHLQADWEEQEAINRQLIGAIDEMINDSYPLSEREEDQRVEANNDWISDIARPRSAWEGLRKARYQEMLDPYMEKGDIRALLQRRSVSTFLSSGLRERIEQLMISRTQGQQPLPHLTVSNHCNDDDDDDDDDDEEEEEEEEEYDDEDEDKDKEEEEEEEYDDEEEEEEEEISPIGRIQYNEVGEYFDHRPTSSSLRSPSPSLYRSRRSNNRNHDINDDSDQFASSSLRQSPSTASNSHSQDSRQRSSVEMELIYDLRGHMEQLHQEMYEIRKSIKSCASMQAKLQHSIKQEVATAFNHSVRREGKESYRRVPKNGRCCICSEMPVDSLLYRCGHMCTCFKCAHELQWSGGKCPICRAPILDVVRPHAR